MAKAKERSATRNTSCQLRALLQVGMEWERAKGGGERGDAFFWSECCGRRELWADIRKNVIPSYQEDSPSFHVELVHCHLAFNPRHRWRRAQYLRGALCGTHFG